MLHYSYVKDWKALEVGGYITEKTHWHSFIGGRKVMREEHQGLTTLGVSTENLKAWVSLRVGN